MSNWIIFHITLLNWEFLLKWYNFVWDFCWDRYFLLCTTISTDFNSQISFPSCWGVGSRKFLKGRKFWKRRSWSRIFYLRLRNPACYLSMFNLAYVVKHIQSVNRYSINNTRSRTTRRQLKWQIHARAFMARSRFRNSNISPTEQRNKEPNQQHSAAQGKPK